MFTDAGGRSAVAAWWELGSEGKSQLNDRIGWIVAWAVTLPLLVQSAVLAMSAGAVGGGLARLWEMLGYSRLRRQGLYAPLAAIERAVRELPKQTNAEVIKAESDRLINELHQVQTAVERTEAAARESDRTPFMNAVLSGGGSALVLWLLTTSGLFLLSGGDNATSASPNVLLALSLAAGLAYQQVIGRIFDMTRDYVSGDKDDDDA